LGFSLSISLHSDLEHLPDKCVALYERILARSAFGFAEVLGPYETDPPKVSLQQLPKDQLHELARDILSPDSVEALWVGLQYQGATGRWFSLIYHLNGPKHQHGLRVFNDGYLRLSIYESETYRPLEKFLPELGLPIVSYDDWWSLSEEVRDKLETLAEEESDTNVYELFLRACGLFPMAPKGSYTTKDAPQFEHAIMYSDRAYSSLVGCYAVFHRQPREFGRDLKRLYLEYNQGNPISETLAPGQKLGDLKPPVLDPRWRMGKPGKEDPDYFRYFEFATPGTRDVQEFLDGLDEATVDRLFEISDARVREIFAEMGASNTVPDVSISDFGECGLVVYTRSLSGVWRVYRHILHHGI
jgi:hypothetical protein